MIFEAVSNKANTAQRGFSLIELMIVTAIIAILASFVYPSYVDQVRKSRRSEAKAALSDAAARMEQYFLDRKTYNTTDMTQLGYSADPHLTEGGYYSVDISAATATSYTLTATAQAKGGQTKDTSCTPMQLTSTGVKTPTGCW